MTSTDTGKPMKAKNHVEVSPFGAEDRVALRKWTPPWYAMPVHAELEWQVERGLNGEENTVVIGTRGVGKSRTVASAIQRVENRELHRVATMKLEEEHDQPRAASGHLPSYPRGIVCYDASNATGTKTALRDLLAELRRRVTPSEVRNWTPREFVKRTLEQLVRRQTHLVCIDEAQNINADNLEHLRQVYDLARSQGYPMGIILVGDYRLRDRLVSTGQMGQRYTGMIEFPRFETLVGELEQWHPHLKQLKNDMAAKDWRRITSDLGMAANGSFRRLVAILENANALALRLDRRINEEVLRMAIQKLAPEA